MPRSILTTALILIMFLSTAVNGKQWTLAHNAVTGTVTTIAEENDLGFGLSEDGKRLVIFFYGKDKLVVRDIASGSVEAELKVTHPTDFLWRGNKLYVTSDGKGIIEVFSVDQDYKKINELKVGNDFPKQMQAAEGKWFDGLIYVGCKTKDSGRWENYQVSTKEDKSLKISVSDGEWMSRLDPTGQYAFIGDHVWRSEDLFNPDSEPFVKERGPRSWYPLSLPVFGSIRASTNGLFRSRGFGDAQLPVIYNPFNRQKGGLLEIYHQNWPSVHIGSVISPLPIGFNDLDGQIPRPTYDQKRLIPVATTIDGVGYAFWNDGHPGSKVLKQFAFPAFHVPIHDKLDSEPGPQKRWPRIWPSATMLQYKVHSELEQPNYEIQQGPKGASITTDGILTWSPTREQLGPVRIKVAAREGNRLETLLFHVTIVPDKDFSSDHRPRHAIFHNITPHVMAIRHDNKGVFVIDGNILYELDSSGIRILRRQLLPRMFSHLQDGPSGLVGISKHDVVLLDRKTLQVKVSLKLPVESPDVAAPFSLIVHPAMNACYISVFDASKETIRVSGGRTFYVDFKAQTVKETKDIDSYLLYKIPDKMQLIGISGPQSKKVGQLIDISRGYPEIISVSDSWGSQAGRITFLDDGRILIPRVSSSFQKNKVDGFPIVDSGKNFGAYVTHLPISNKNFYRLDSMDSAIYESESDSLFLFARGYFGIVDLTNSRVLLNQSYDSDTSEVPGTIANGLLAPDGKSLLLAYAWRHGAYHSPTTLKFCSVNINTLLEDPKEAFLDALD